MVSNNALNQRVEIVGEQSWLSLRDELSRDSANQMLSPGLVKLIRWPDLSTMPDELAEPVARICALLWRKSTVSYLIARILDADPRRTAVLLRVLQACGCVQLQLVAGRTESSSTDNTEAIEAPMADTVVKNERSSMISKFWKRLLEG